MSKPPLEYQSRDREREEQRRTLRGRPLLSVASITLSTCLLIGFPMFDVVVRPPGSLQEEVILCVFAGCVVAIFLGVLSWALNGRHWQAQVSIVLAIIAGAVASVLGRS